MTEPSLSWRDFETDLRAGLAKPREARNAWRAFEPSLSYGRHAGPSDITARLAAVAILAYPLGDSPHVALTLRHEHLRSHGGQISFPGGSIDAGETAAAAALRELEEELGVSSADVRIAGELSPLYIFNSNFVVTPVVLLAPNPPHFTLQDAEVAELLQTPLAQLLSPAARGRHLIHRAGAEIDAPHLAFGDHKIWGATCMILAEFLSLLPHRVRA